MKAHEFDARFEAGEDVAGVLSRRRARRIEEFSDAAARLRARLESGGDSAATIREMRDGNGCEGPREP